MTHLDLGPIQDEKHMAPKCEANQKSTKHGAVPKTSLEVLRGIAPTPNMQRIVKSK